ncbi:hypothetical protein [Micromonospora sp. HM5-17]|uniref:hypothetical protein n=1 Tax=Micromonospora sp. HM5-17 TaxID=2487710 RepID=UPI000F49747D|nr:hypothetical protein [Micromonospora sp. HM5-17]ROT34015.1 hypothetical protein EF879_03825 [Micromonospora sp. HM5-17]
MGGRGWRNVLLAVVAGLALTGCQEERGMQPTITAEQAAQRVEELLQEAYGQLPPGAELETFDEGPLPCDDPTDGGPAGRVYYEKRYQVIFPAGWPADQALPRLAEYWGQRGYRTIDDLRDHPDPRLVVERPDDGFRAIISVWNRDSGAIDIYLTGSSPCVWEHGTPDPQ